MSKPTSSGTAALLSSDPNMRFGLLFSFFWGAVVFGRAYYLLFFFSFLCWKLKHSVCVYHVLCDLLCLVFCPRSSLVRRAATLDRVRHEDIARCNKGNSAIFIPNVIVVQDKSGKVWGREHSKYSPLPYKALCM